MKKSISCLLIFVALFLTGCNSGSLPDTYIAESDYQYRQWSDGIFFPKLQQGDGIVYIYHNGFIYYIEEGRDVIMPLCNKADCLHDHEPDIEKRKECNAYMNLYGDDLNILESYMGISKCNDYIYCLNSAASLNMPQTLFRYSSDGTTKEAIYTWNSEESAVLQWIVHRDVLYYVEKRYYLEDNEVIVENSLKSLALTGINRKPETIYVADKDLSVLSLGNPQAYGNYVYFEIFASRNEEGEPVPEDGIYDSLYEKTFVYDIQRDSLKELSVPGQTDSVHILGVQFWQDKIIMDPYDYEKEENAPMPVYIADLDGSNPDVLLEDIPQAGYFLSDGEYLYFFDDWMPDIDDWLSNPGLYTVYDKDMNIVDTFTAPIFPDGRPERLPVGEKDRMYFVYEDKEDGTWSLMSWDKGDIGSYNGKSFSMTEIKYH